MQVLKAIEQAQAACMFGNCQDAALSLCDYIEDIEGKGMETVNLLIEYCELLFKANSGEIKGKHLNRHLIKIENSVRHKLRPNKLEVVFLSYKSSMSDSLESIYLAAKEDPSVDAIWLPIPYIELRADKTINRIVCEDQNYYPNYIECTNWEKYDIEKRKPDAIFTFNPYDRDNLVTSVHPNFYTERLCNLTDMLVYVPYFVGGEVFQEHFATLPGCVYSHKVIVQSEQLRKKYVKAYKNIYGCAQGNPEEKFMALGSPKFDKIINSTPEDFTLPSEWCEIIGDKKAVLYNTTIVALLQGNLQYLNKIRHVINCFKHREDVVLWWRPHPLNEAACKSMRPELLAEYKEIIDEFKNNAFGIYDDTPYLHRAITLTDAYFGGWGSVAPLYMATGKPVMINAAFEFSNEMNLNVGSMLVLDDCFWVIPRGANALFLIDKNKPILNLMGSFPSEDDNVMQSHSLYGNPAINDGIIYFPPSTACEIAACSTADNIFEKIPYKKTVKSKKIVFDFIAAVSYGSFVYFIPKFYPAIVRLDTKTKKIDYYDDWLKYFGSFPDVYSNQYFTNYAIEGSTIFMVSKKHNAVIDFNMETYRSNIHEIGEKEYRFYDICSDGSNLWLTPQYRTKSPLIKWNIKKRTAKEFKDILGINGYRLAAFSCGNHVYFMSDLCNRVSGLITINTVDDTIIFDADFLTVLGYMCQHQGYLYGCAFTADKIIEYDFSSKKQKDCDITVRLEDKTKLASLAIASLSGEINAESDDADMIISGFHDVMRENGVVGINEYLSFVSSYKNDMAISKRRVAVAKALNANTDGSSGKNILDYVRGQLL